MRYLKGNIIDMALAGEFDLIAHGANCFCTMGAGLAKEIKRRLPEAYEADLKTSGGDPNKLGTASLASVRRGSVQFQVANLYTQYHWGSPRPPRDTREIRLQAIESSLRHLSVIVSAETRLALPKIGAGLAHGRWDEIEAVIGRVLPRTTIVVL